MTELREVRPEDRELLWNIHQKYLYEMTNFYDDEMDEAGNYSYGYFDAYFTEPQRKALFIYSERKMYHIQNRGEAAPPFLILNS